MRESTMTRERDALDFVRMLPTSGETLTDVDVEAFRMRWESLNPDDQWATAAALANLLGSLAELEAGRRGATRDEVLRQMEADIRGDRGDPSA